MNLDTTGKIKKYNPRREYHGDEGVLAGDIDIEVNIDIAELNQIAVDKADFKKMLYKDSGDVKALCFNQLRFFREFEEMRVELQIDEDAAPIVLSDVKIKKLTANIHPGYRADLSFQVQLHPNEDESGELHAAMVKNDIVVKVMKESGQQDIEG